MYACICKAITDQQTREAVAAGAKTMRDLRQRLGVCAGCGKCGPYVRAILLASQPALQPTPGARLELAPG